MSVTTLRGRRQPTAEVTAALTLLGAHVGGAFGNLDRLAPLDRFPAA